MAAQGLDGHGTLMQPHPLDDITDGAFVPYVYGEGEGCETCADEDFLGDEEWGEEAIARMREYFLGPDIFVINRIGDDTSQDDDIMAAIREAARSS